MVLNTTGVVIRLRGVKRMRSLLLLLLSAVLLVLFATANAQHDEKGAEVIRLVNEEREQAGLAPLSEDQPLLPAAQTRAREASKKFSHTRPNGAHFKTIFTDYQIRSTYRGENLAYGFDTPEEVVEGWMESNTHKANILDPNFTHIAVACEQIDGIQYWSQLFMKPASDCAAWYEDPLLDDL